MKLSKRDRLRISEQAALRLIRSHENDSEQSRADFLEWSRLSMHHVQEMLFVQAVSKQLEGMDPQRAIDVDSLPTLPELVASLDDRESSVPGISPPPAIADRTRRWRWGIGLAAACALIAVAWVFMSLELSGAQSYATAVGEQRSIQLHDGSVMVLNTGSRVKVDFSKSVRQVRLIDGEALFVVRHESARPFQVSTDTGTVVAIGTQFNVYRQGGSTRVSVIEGVVRVSVGTTDARVGAARLAAGDEATVGQGRIVKTKQPDIQRAVAWRTRQLMFRDSALASVAEEFNRYNKTQIRVEGSDLRARSISGVFDADDSEPLIDFLEGDPQLAVVRSADGILIKPRNMVP